MRAVDIENGSGPASSLFISDAIEKPIPGPGQAVIKVKYFGINRMDLMQREGQYPVPPQAGKILGVEFSGIIDSLHETNVDSFKVGDEVFGLTYGGAYAEYVAVATAMLIAKPPSMPWPVAAGVPEVWITALQALSVVGEFSSGKSVLWHAGASSVSVAGIQISKALGATAIYATVGSDEKVRFCESLGATKAWNYSSRNWEVELRKETDGKGVDIIVDFIGQKYWQMNLNSTALDGRIVILGLLSGGRITAGEDGNTLVDLTPLVHKRLRVEGSLLRSRSLEYQRLLRDRLVQDLLPRFVDGTFQVPIERVFDWTEIQDAHSLMESNTIKGKVVCQVT